MSEKPKDYLPFLDTIRGIAILAVFFFHVLGIAFGRYNLPWRGFFRDFAGDLSFIPFLPFSYGYYGVAVFFAVSGFCIHLSHERASNKNWFQFFSRRWFRIYPAYLLAVLFFFFSWPWGSLSIENPLRLKQLVTHLLAVHNLFPDTYFGINPSFWSIAIELQLYAIYPLLVFLVRKTGWAKTLLICWVIENGIILLPLLSGKPLPYFVSASPFAYWFSWSIGAYLAQCYLDGRRSVLKHLRLDVMVILAFSCLQVEPLARFSFWMFALLTAVLIDRLLSGHVAFSSGRLRGAIWSHLGFLGMVSYSFYLFHQPLLGPLPSLTLEAFQKFVYGFVAGPEVRFLVCCLWYPFILVWAYTSFRFVEKPSIRAGQRFWTMIHRPE